MVSKGEEVIKEFMRFKVRMEGSMNGHEFEIEGEGEGRPYEGTQTAKLKVTKGGPLPFAWDILSPQFMYGSKAYVKHPADIPDYKKLSFPEGFKWERVMNFEDGGLVTVTQDSSLQDGTLIYKVKMRGTNFPPDGPVMQKKTMGWEASTERLYPRDGVLKGEIHQALKLKDGGHYLVEFKTIYMAKKPVQLPGYYYVDTKLDITSHNEDYTIVEQYERSEGRHHLFLGHGTGSTGSGSSGTASSEDNNMAVIKEFMRFKVRMEGSMNGHEFEIEGEGEGRPYEGTQTAKLKVTKGGPLPFAWDILSPQFMYGSKAYVKHPADIPDYKKLSFPEGFKWERVMNFEDGGLVTVTQDSSLQDGTLIYKVKMRGTNFPPDGPVMQKKTMGWEASTERLYPRDGVLKGEIHQALKLKDGGHYLVEFKTIYMAKKPVQLPGYYYVDTKLDITSHNEDYTIVEQYERSEGRHHLFLYGMDELYKLEMAVEGGMKCVKFLLYVLLLAFCACAVGLIAVGVGAQLVLSQTIIQGATPGSLLPVVIIAVGVFLFLVAFVGCCGACKENYCLMITFAIFLSLIMLVEVAAAIAGYVFRDKVMSEFNNNFRQQMENYPKNNHTASILDRMQADFKCCGAANYTDWEKIPSMSKNRVPDSCCINVTVGCGINFNEKAIHKEGCVEKIGGWLRKNVLVVAAAALGIAFVEVLGIVFACCLVKSIRSGYEVM